MSETDEIKEWQAFSAMHQIAGVLMLDEIPFSYSEENGIMFTAPDFYVENLKQRLVWKSRCILPPVGGKKLTPSSK